MFSLKPKLIHILLSLFFGCFLLISCSDPFEQGVKHHKNKALEYLEDQFGNHIPDYSYSGYEGGGIALPKIKTVTTLHPSRDEKDDTERIQLAINALSLIEPDSNGFRGAILLKAGIFRVKENLHISASGIVLRGEGQFIHGTQIIATGSKRRNLIILSGIDSEQDAFNEEQRNKRFLYRQKENSKHAIIDSYLPSGSKIVQVSPVKGLQVGDTVILEQRMNQQWIHRLGMDNIPPHPNGKEVIQWNYEDFVFQFERTISDIQGGRIHLNEPLVNPIFAQFGSNLLFKAVLPNRIQNSGIENIRLVSEFRDTPAKNNENHSWVAIEIARAKNCWVKQVTAVHFAHSTVSLEQEAIQNTVEDCAFLDPIARKGMGRSYGFRIAGQKNLVQRCYASNARNAFSTAPQTCGPNSFVDCFAAGENTLISPERSWSMGTLWDNSYASRLMIRNRGYDGQGWGWPGINHMLWNCVAKNNISVQSPINGWNWAIGCRGDRAGLPFSGLAGHYSQNQKAARPRSLYIRQIEDRLGKAAVTNVTINSQITGSVLFYLQDTLSE